MFFLFGRIFFSINLSSFQATSFCERICIRFSISRELNSTTNFFLLTSYRTLRRTIPSHPPETLQFQILVFWSPKKQENMEKIFVWLSDFLVDHSKLWCHGYGGGYGAFCLLKTLVAMPDSRCLAITMPNYHNSRLISPSINCIPCSIIETMELTNGGGYGAFALLETLVAMPDSNAWL